MCYLLLDVLSEALEIPGLQNVMPTCSDGLRWRPRGVASSSWAETGPRCLPWPVSKAVASWASVAGGSIVIVSLIGKFTP